MKPIRDYFGGFGNSLFQYSYIYAQARDGNIPDIYIQDFKYFEKYKEEIRAIFREEVPERKDMVALHIRRGDYVNNSFYVDLTKTDYYERAIAMFPNEKFLVFCADRQPISDDVGDREWVKEYLDSKGIDWEFWNGKDEIEDINAMASCKSHIQANSTFSTWAGFINPYKEKIIAPILYYTDGVERTVRPKDEGWIFI